MAKESDSLTPREVECMRAIFVHGAVPQAAAALFISANTLRVHLYHIRKKTGLHYLDQLTVLAERLGYLEGLEPSRVIGRPRSRQQRH